VAEYRVAELARAADTTVRNVRVYQDRGLLPPPRRQGRIGLYSEAHLARLKLIGRLLARGYTFATIGELFNAWHSGKDLADTLGLREALTAPWNPEEPIRLTRKQLARQFPRFTPAAIERAEQIGILVREGDGFTVPSPSLLEAGVELAAAGVPLDAVLDLAGDVQQELNKVAHRFIEVLLAHVVESDDGRSLAGPLTEEAAARLLRLRPFAQRTVDALLLMAMQRESDILLEHLKDDVPEPQLQDRA
jgi:DNA-binding transcriptional MerR regulator